MKIGMMGAWNTDSGVAIHAELIGREWVRQRHSLKVFTFIKSDFHGHGLTRDRDESYVTRCFGTSAKTNYLDPRPILTEKHYDVFVVQDLRMLPHENLAKIYPALRRKCKLVVHVFHENHLPKEPWFYQFDWDAVVYFDDRQRFIEEVYENSFYIPFPCAPWRVGDEEEARVKLNLPLDKKIILIFAQRSYSPYLPDLPDQLRGEVLLLILSERDKAPDILESYSRRPGVEVRAEKTLSWRRLDEYVFASDAVVLHKFRSRGQAVVSSTVFQLLGAGKPIMVPKHSEFFHPLDSEVLRYGDNVELGKLVAEVVEGSSRVKKVVESARRYVEENSAEKIAREYINLFEELIRST